MGAEAKVSKKRTWTFRIVLAVFPHLKKQLANFQLCPRRKTFFCPVNMEYLRTCKLRKYSILSKFECGQVVMESLETLTLLHFRHCLKDNLKFLYRAQDVTWIRLGHFCQLDLASVVRNRREAFGSNSMKFTFLTPELTQGRRCSPLEQCHLLHRKGHWSHLQQQSRWQLRRLQQQSCCHCPIKCVLKGFFQLSQIQT